MRIGRSRRYRGRGEQPIQCIVGEGARIISGRACRIDNLRDVANLIIIVCEILDLRAATAGRLEIRKPISCVCIVEVRRRRVIAKECILDLSGRRIVKVAYDIAK